MKRAFPITVFGERRQDVFIEAVSTKRLGLDDVETDTIGMSCLPKPPMRR